MTSSVAETIFVLDVTVRAVVTNCQFVSVTAVEGLDGLTVFHVVVDPKDQGKLIGRGGQLARSLRTILCAIAKENGCRYSLHLDDLKRTDEGGGFSEAPKMRLWKQGS